MHSGDRGLAGDIGHFDAASGIPGELQSSADGHTLGRGIDVAPIIPARRGGALNVLHDGVFARPYSTHTS